MVKNTIWVAGATGKLGSQLVKLLKQNTSNKIIATGSDVDITDIELVEQNIDIYRPSVVINCAAITDKELCEKDIVEAYKVNALGARNLAAASRKVNAKIIHLSTDDVFAGENTLPLTEFDAPNPKSVYGKSKLAGENYIKELNPKHLIIRSSWVYGQGSGDFYSKVLELAEKGEKFDIATDRVGTPTSTQLLAEFIVSLLDKAEYGIYHASCEGACTRSEYAKAILALNGYPVSLVNEVEVNENGKIESTVLENLMMKMTGVFEMPSWEDALKDYVASVKEGK